MKEISYKILKKSILSSMILVPAIPFILALSIGYYYFTTSLENRTISSMNRIVEDHSHIIDVFLKERKANLEFIADSYSFKDLIQSKTIEKVFKHLQKQSNAFSDLGIINEDGVHLSYCGPYELIGKIYKNAEWFNEVLKQGYYISDIFLGYRQIPHFIIAVAKQDEKQKWIIRASIDTNMFNELVKKVHLGKTGEAYILNSKGLLQTERRSGGKLMDKPAEKVQFPVLPREIKTFIAKDQKGESYLYTTTWLKNKNWALFVRQEKSDVFKAFSYAAYLILVTSVMGGILIITVAFYLTNRIIKSIKSIDQEKDVINKQLIRATKLAELGEMAAGFAHEINNPLQIIKSEQSLIELLITEMEEKEVLKTCPELLEVNDSLAQIKLQISRCAEITQSILKFARQSKPLSQNVSLQKFIPEVIDMIIKKASVNGISIRQETIKDIPPVNCDQGQLQQVFLNLFNNAMDAIIERHGSQGGELAVSSRYNKGKQVEIAFTDNGCGINTENLKKIFSPFFTTKPVGKGTGLGLSVCYGIINNMGGTMEVQSEIGIGTTFIVKLPQSLVNM